jgi:hypothetical protein
MITDYHQRALRHATRDQRAPPHRRHEQPVGHPAVDVLDRGHPAPARGEQRRHHDDPGRQVGDVGLVAEAGQVGHALEQLAEQQQPDQRLHERHRDEPRLAPERPQVAQRQIERVPHSKLLPAWRR